MTEKEELHQLQNRGKLLLHQEENADEENDSQDQTETADELVYWGPNHQPKL